MKKFLSLLLAAVLLLSCCACAAKNTHEDDHGESLAAVFPSGVTICGADVTGLTAETVCGIYTGEITDWSAL